MDVGARTGLECFTADGDGSSLEFVFGKDGGAGAGDLGSYESEVGGVFVRGFDADVGARDEETLRIGAGCGDVFLFGGGD